MISVHAIRPKVLGFIPRRGRCIFKGGTDLQLAFFGGEVKPSATCRKILRHVKNPSKYERDTL
jgi:hypothetical protein